MDGHLWGMWGAGHAWFWPGAPFLLFFSIGLIVVGLWLIRSGARPWDHVRATPAREILDERYAAGELNTEEYEERLQHLRGKATLDRHA